MLYRIWEVPLTLNTSAEPSIRLVSMTPAPGTIGYIRDNTGTVTVYGPSATECIPQQDRGPRRIR